MMTNELVSVLMPAYNAERFISGAIKSILAQTHRRLELIIVNDGSTDSTLGRIAEFHDERIRLYNRSHLGHGVQRNFALSVAQGRYIAVMDADDVSEPARLSEQLRFLIEHPAIDVVGSNCFYIDEYGETIKRTTLPYRHDDIEFMMPIICSVIHPSVMFTRTSLESVGGYAEEKVPTMDQELFLRLMKAGRQFHNIQEPLHRYRVWKGSMTLNTITLGKHLSYRNGYSYILETRSIANRADKFRYYRRLGLLEYYKGDLTKARSYFFRSLITSPIMMGKVARFLLPSLLGNTVMTKVRHSGFSRRINILLARVIGWESQKLW